MRKPIAIVIATGLLYSFAGPASAGLIISEFRLNGTNGANDEFIEIYNNSNSAVTVNASDGSAGFALAASDGVARFVIPNNTVIPPRGHYLGCNSVGYSQAGYPAGNGTTATCDATYTTNISNGEDPDGAGPGLPLPRRGIALFKSADPANFTLENRLDAVGPTAEADTLYKEGTGVRNLVHHAIAYSYVRRLTGGCIGTNPGTVDSNCTSENTIKDTLEPTSPFPQDTNDNRADFIFVDTNGVQASSEGSQQRLGAPGPENLSSPVVRNGAMKIELVDPGTCVNCSPNQVRDLTNDPAEPNDTLGSLFIRRKIINRTGSNVTRLRFRIVDITTFPSAVFLLPPPPNDSCSSPDAKCAADLRALSSTDVIVSLSAASGGGTAVVRGTTIEQAAGPENQPNGGAFNSTFTAGIITLASPLAAFDNPETVSVKENEVNVQFRLGIQQQGPFRFAINVEVLP